MRHSRLRVSRESNLLIVTIAICAAALLLLARLRFPTPPPAAAVTTPPLERLAARAAYDDLAAAIGRIEQTIAPNLIVLRMTSRSGSTPMRVTDLLATTEAERSQVHHVPALRIGSQAAVAWLAGGMAIDGIEGAAGVAALAGLDPLRHLARIQLSAAGVRQFTLKPLAELQTPSYIVAVEGTDAGVTARPVFIGHADRFGSPRWGRPLLPLGGVPVTPGALMFALDGDFLGIAVLENGALAIASAMDVVDTAERLARDPGAAPVSAGIAVQPLTPLLAAAAGTPRGVVVSEVDNDGPAAGALQPGDVITTLDDQPVTAPEAFLFSIASRTAGDTVRIAMVRSGATQQVSLVLAPARDAAASAPQDTNGLVLTTVRREGTRVTSVGRGSALDRLGIEAGDVITHAGDVEHPSAPQLRKMLAAIGPRPLMIAVRRGERQWIVAVPSPSGDAGR